VLVSTLEEARAFLAARRIAVVGVSRDPKEFSRYVFRELAQRGLDVVPVNPALVEAEGKRAFARVQDVKPAAEAALVLAPAARAEEVVRDCVAAGVRRIWFHRGGGPGSASPPALALCRERGVAVIEGLCPFMALSGAGFPHRVHGFFRRAFAGSPHPHA
jgi:predicted CoA-binding protein